MSVDLSLMTPSAANRIEVHLCEEVAFLDFNFAPPVVRRDVGMLGLIHKRIQGLAHPAYESLLPWAPSSRYVYRGNFTVRHDK